MKRYYITLTLLMLITITGGQHAFAQDEPAVELQVEVETQTATTILLIGDYQSINEIDVQSAALLVAQELRKQGVSVSDPVFEAPPAVNVYRVSFSRLSEKIQVRLTQENPVGTIVTEKQLWIADIEEMIAAAPRLVEAVLDEKPIASTIDTETVTEHEKRVRQKITGGSHLSLGFVGIYIPDTNIVGKGGADIGYFYDALSYAIETKFMFGAHGEFSFFSLSMGGRYFFNKRNISPYVGWGLAIISGMAFETNTIIRTRDSTRTIYIDGNVGSGAYAAVGIEFFRLYRGGLNLELRVEQPFFSLETRDTMPIITLGIHASF